MTSGPATRMPLCATSGGSAEAWRDAIGRVERFLAEHLAKRE
jgi:hypothetical protein